MTRCCGCLAAGTITGLLVFTAAFAVLCWFGDSHHLVDLGNL